MSATRSDRPQRVALLGCGTVGREVARRLGADGPRLGLSLTGVLVRDARRDRGVEPGLLTARFDDVLRARPDVVVEVIGGVDPARQFVGEALGRGIPVVTANKTLVARHGGELGALGRRNRAAFAFEASVAGAVPVIAVLRQLEGDRVLSIRGVLNGTCNFIFTRMESHAETMEQALAEAKRRGLAEPDPQADLSGRDTAEKLCVLAAAAGRPELTPEQVACAGIEAVTPGDIAAARRNGQVLRLVGEIELNGDHPRARVGPAILPRAHALAAAREEQNAVVVTTELAGELVFQGRGAGPQPTTSAILGDVVRLVRSREAGDGASVPASYRVAPGAARSGPALRRHVIRVPRAGHDAGRVLGALAAHGIAPEELTLGRDGALVRTGHVTEEEAARCAGAMADGQPQCGTLVMPIVE